ncbi:MAG: DASS family sodium-coupled anion symporter [Egibacteraceae bacterium]
MSSYTNPDDDDALDLVHADDATEGEADVSELAEPTRTTRRSQIGRLAAPAGAIAVWVALGAAPGLAPEGRAVAAVAVLMGLSWLTEALPLPATALLPIALFPLLGVTDIGGATEPYANDIIYLFMGGFMLALAMQRWGLHRRIALRTVAIVGTRPSQLVGGFMLATAFLSMWVSNTATTVMMLPIGVSVLMLVLRQMGEGPSADDLEAADAGGPRVQLRFATALMLGIAYAASIGSLATPIGTPPNTFLLGFVNEAYGIDIAFGQWMLLGLPLAAVFLALAWLVLTKLLFPPELDELPGGSELIDAELAKLGPMGRGERTVLTIFVGTALAWMSRGFLADWEGLVEAVPAVGALSDAGIGMIAVLLAFVIPVNRKAGVFVLSWDAARRIPWGILVLFGGGLSLAAAVQSSGLDEWIGTQVTALGALPLLTLVVAVVTLIILLTELTSNTATAATFLPILGGVGVGLGYDPLVLVVPAALAASSAFMMPVATPPNAIVFGSGHVTIAQMVRAGVWLNVIGVVLIVSAVYLLGGPVLGIGL